MAKKNVNLRIGWDLKAFSDSQQNLVRELKKTAKEMKSIGKDMSTYITAPLALMGGFAIKSAAQFESLKTSLVTSLGGSKEAAAAAFKEIEKFASSTPFQMQEVASAFIKLKNMGLDPSMSALESYGNTASSMGKSLNDMVEAVADAAVGEFERLKEFGIKAKSQGDNVSFTFKGVTTTVKKNSEEIEEYLQNIGKTEFAGGIKAQSETFNGTMSTLSDNVAMAAASFGDLMIPVLKRLSSFLQGAAETMRSLTPEAKKIIIVVAGIAAAIGPLIYAVGALTTAFAFLAANPIVLIIGGIVLALGTLGAAFVYVKDNTQAFADFFYNLWVKIANGFIDTIKFMISGFLKLANVLGLDIDTGVNAFLDSFKLKARESTAQFGSFSDALNLFKKENEDVASGVGETTKAVEDLGAAAGKTSKEIKQLGIDFTKGIAAADLQTPAIESITKGLKSKGLKFDEPIKAPVQIDIKPIELPQELFDQQAAAAARRQAADLGEEMGDALSSGLKSLATEGLTQFGEFLGTVISGGDMTVKDFGRGLLDSLGKFMSQFGEAMVAMGIAQIMLDVALKSFNPALAIIGGVALVAAGAAISNLSKKGISEGSSGGSSFSGGGNFSSMSGIGANMQPIVLDTRISGRDMIITQGRESQFRR